MVPVERGLCLDKDTIIRREIIKDIRTYFSIDANNISNKYQIDFYKYFAKEINNLKPFFNDELIFIQNEKIYLTEIGKHFANLIGSNFDTFIDSKRFNDRIEYNSSLKI